MELLIKQFFCEVFYMINKFGNLSGIVFKIYFLFENILIYFF